MGMNKKQKEGIYLFDKLISEMSNKKLKDTKIKLDKEIRLSDTTIKEGFEK